MGTVHRVDIASKGGVSILAEPTRNRTWLDKRDRDAGTPQFQTHRIGQRFERVLRRVIGTAIGEAHRAENGPDLNDAPPTLPAKHWYQKIGEFLGAEHVRLELAPQGVASKVLDCPVLAIGPVVDQGIESPAGACQDFICRRADRVR